MFRHALQNIGFRKSLAGLILWPRLVTRLWQRQKNYWRISGLVSLILLTGCSIKPDSVSLTPQQFQNLVSVGFLSPQIRTFDLQPFMVVQIYLDAPLVSLDKQSAVVNFEFQGKLDAEIMGGSVTEQLSISILGQSGLLYDTGERTVSLHQVELQDTRIDLDIALLRTMILDQFQKALSQELEHIPLISLVQVPEFEEQLVDLSERGNIQIVISEDDLVFSLEPSSKE